MKQFIARYPSLVTGVLSGFDRLGFRGSLLPLFRRGGLHLFLAAANVRLLDFKKFAVTTTERVKQASLCEAHKLDRPVEYLEVPSIDKEDFARQLLAKHPVQQGLIGVLKALEPCMTFEYRRSQNREKRGFRLRPGKCLHFYKYYLHPRFGFINARIQTGLPFNVQILRAHGVIRKVNKTHRYRLTKRGELLTAALFASRSANIHQLLAAA